LEEGRDPEKHVADPGVWVPAAPASALVALAAAAAAAAAAGAPVLLLLILLVLLLLLLLLLLLVTVVVVVLRVLQPGAQLDRQRAYLLDVPKYGIDLVQREDAMLVGRILALPLQRLDSCIDQGADRISGVATPRHATPRHATPRHATPRTRAAPMQTRTHARTHTRTHTHTHTQE
jgi:hypothetical protein